MEGVQLETQGQKVPSGENMVVLESYLRDCKKEQLVKYRHPPPEHSTPRGAELRTAPSRWALLVPPRPQPRIAPTHHGAGAAGQRACKTSQRVKARGAVPTRPPAQRNPPDPRLQPGALRARSAESSSQRQRGNESLVARPAPSALTPSSPRSLTGCRGTRDVPKRR